MSVSSRLGTINTDWRGLRWSAALMAAAVVLGFGRLFWVYEDLIGFATETSIIAVMGAAVVLGIGGLGDPAVSRRRRPPIEARPMFVLRILDWLPVGARTLLALQFLGLLAVTGIAAVRSPGSGLIGGLGALLLLLLIVEVDGTLRSDREPASARTRMATAILLAGLIVATLIFDILHLMVWNPQTKLPGLTLEQIYAGLAEANKAQMVPLFLVLWCIFWGLPALLLPVLSHFVRLSLRIILLVGLLLLGGAIFTGWFAAFGMGLGIADSFEEAADGAEAALVSRAALNLTCQIALAAAVIIALAPTRAAGRLSVATARIGA